MAAGGTRWRAWACWGAVGLGSVAALAGLDYWVGTAQDRALEARKALRAKLDRLAWYGLRYGIDDIRYAPERDSYLVKFRIQNATDEPIFVMVPSFEAFVQVGAGWKVEEIAEPPGVRMEGSVIKLMEDREVPRELRVKSMDYMELMDGYMHVRLSMETIVSPEDNPQEEVGERREDMVMYVRDMRRVSARFASDPRPEGRPLFIPLRVWTLVPKRER